MKRSQPMRALAAAMLVAFVAGCGSSASKPENAVQPNPADQNATDEAGKQSEAERIAAAMNELSPADREVAMAQAVCPVSDEPLGTMGKPIKVTVEGRDVFLCCEGCRPQITQEPAKYLAKLAKKP